MDFATEREHIAKAMSVFQGQLTSRSEDELNAPMSCCGRSFRAHVDEHLDGLTALDKLLDGDVPAFMDHILTLEGIPAKRFAETLAVVYIFRLDMSPFDKIRRSGDLLFKIAEQYPEVMEMLNINVAPRPRHPMPDTDGLPPELAEFVAGLADEGIQVQIIRIPPGDDGFGDLGALLSGHPGDDDELLQ